MTNLMAKVSRPQHIKILAFLETMNAQVLEDMSCYFGGGTAISLLNDEFRLSVDVDFMCANNEGYAMLRNAVYENGISSLFKTGQTPKLLREMRADRDGVRMAIDMDGTPLKFEIVREVRIELSIQTSYFPVPTLSKTSLFAEKLLANTDRGLDKYGLSKDMIDLIIMQSHWGKIPDSSILAAYKAYGAAPGKAFEKTFNLLAQDRAHLLRCFRELDMSEDSINLVHGYLGKADNALSVMTRMDALT